MKSSSARGARSQADAGPLPRMGGIALKNGLVLLSDLHWAAAIREPDGAISLASGRKPRLPVAGGVAAPGAPGPEAGDRGSPRGGAGRRADTRRPITRRRVSRRGGAGEGIPLVRGLGRFGESLLVLAVVKARLPRAELPLEGGRVAAALAGSLAATSAVRALAPKSAIVQETGTALAAFVPAVLALRNSPISGYHGAEHKVIGGREAALREGYRAPVDAGPAAADDREPGDSRAAAKEHDRCGSNLVGPYLLATVATNLLVRSRSGKRSSVASAVAGAVSLGAALEALRWATRNGDSVLARLLLLPGRTIQKHLTTTEPTAEQLEVGEVALAELIRLERASAR